MTYGELERVRRAEPDVEVLVQPARAVDARATPARQDDPQGAQHPTQCRVVRVRAKAFFDGKDDVIGKGGNVAREL